MFYRLLAGRRNRKSMICRLTLIFSWSLIYAFICRFSSFAIRYLLLFVCSFLERLQAKHEDAHGQITRKLSVCLINLGTLNCFKALLCKIFHVFFHVVFRYYRYLGMLYVSAGRYSVAMEPNCRRSHYNCANS